MSDPNSPPKSASHTADETPPAARTADGPVARGGRAFVATNVTPAKASQKAERDARLKAALKANLGRRKAQTRQRNETDDPA